MWTHSCNGAALAESTEAVDTAKRNVRHDEWLPEREITPTQSLASSVLWDDLREITKLFATWKKLGVDVMRNSQVAMLSP